MLNIVHDSYLFVVTVVKFPTSMMISFETIIIKCPYKCNMLRHHFVPIKSEQG